VDESFPDPLREPVLRKVQHSTISRIDNLVDWVYDEFRQDFYPGETVLVVLDGYDKMSGVVREKARFSEQRRTDGTVEKPAAVRYFVSLVGQPDREAIVDHLHLVRDRKAFTKLMLRSFLKNSLTREAWSGAPWELKDRVAQQYHISTQIPMHLRYEHQVAQRKIQLGIKKGELTNGNLHDYFPKVLPELKPKGKGKSQDALKLRQAQFEEYQKALSRNPNFQGPGKTLSPDDPQFLQFISKHPDFTLTSKQGTNKSALPVIKYPREDLDNEISQSTRPPLKFLATGLSTMMQMNGDGNNIDEESVGLLLETWDTLNVFCEVFLLDSFTFDDFVDAMQPTADGIPSELLSEIHCAVLKTLVNQENNENGKVQIRLPEIDDSEEEEESEEESEDEPTEDPEPDIVARSTRGSLAKTQAAQLKAQAIQDAKLHHGPEIDQCVKNYGWKQRLRKRDLVNGRWVVIVVGLLNLYAIDPRHKQTCDEILAQLAPLNVKPSEDTAIFQYAELDINVRVRILQFLCILTVDTPAIRNYMEECMLAMTECRKTRLDHQRNRKQQ
jgi:DDT domain/ATP-utilising chromatin assembly and remodelling N-terminal/WSTF, HB1, Itc1p, MBD9 motif 1